MARVIGARGQTAISPSQKSWDAWCSLSSPFCRPSNCRLGQSGPFTPVATPLPAQLLFCKQFCSNLSLNAWLSFRWCKNTSAPLFFALVDYYLGEQKDRVRQFVCIFCAFVFIWVAASAHVSTEHDPWPLLVNKVVCLINSNFAIMFRARKRRMKLYTYTR